MWVALQAVTELTGPDLHAVVVLTAIHLLFVATLPERGLISLTGIARLVPVAAAFFLTHWPLAWRAQFETFLAYTQRLDLPAWSDMPGATWVVYLIVALIFLGKITRTGAPIESGLLGGLCAWMIVIQTQGDTRTVFVLVSAVTLLLAALESSHALAFRDQLTGLPGRRAFDVSLRRLGSKYTLAMIDVDRFKKFNDRYGHDAGDEVLRMVASHLRGVRGGGKAFRYGGEEFAVVFPNRRMDDVKEHLENLRVDISDAGFTLRGTDRPKKRPKRPQKSNRGRGAVKITVSIGAAQKSDKINTPLSVFKLADQRMYKAKRGGRNKLVAA